MFQRNGASRIALRLILKALPLALLAFATACADNPAEGVAPAKISEASAPADDQAATEQGEDAADGNPYGETTVYVINPENSKIEFECSKVTRSHVGGFNAFSGELSLVGESAKRASLTVNVETASIWTDTDQLTGHLKSPDFFDVATYPQSTFVLNDVTKAADGYELTGDFTLHGVTKTITIPADITIGDGKVTASSEFAIDRFDFGLEYPGKADDLIRREVVIRLSLNAERSA